MKSTSGAAQSMKHSEILNTKQSFIQRESTDFHVELPPNTKENIYIYLIIQIKFFENSIEQGFLIWIIYFYYGYFKNR